MKFIRQPTCIWYNLFANQSYGFHIHINQEGDPSWFICEIIQYIQHFPLLAELIQIVQAKLTHSRFMIPRISMMRASRLQYESVIRRAAGYAR